MSCRAHAAALALTVFFSVILFRNYKLWQESRCSHKSPESQSVARYLFSFLGEYWPFDLISLNILNGYREVVIPCIWNGAQYDFDSRLPTSPVVRDIMLVMQLFILTTYLFCCLICCLHLTPLIYWHRMRTFRSVFTVAFFLVVLTSNEGTGLLKNIQFFLWRCERICGENFRPS